MARWPKDNQAALIKFYGHPLKEVPKRLVRITPPFKMYYDGKLLKTISFHEKAAPALLLVLNKIWDYYDHDQKLIDKHDISKFAGTYNPRYVRGTEKTTKKWSNHAYGAAIDLDAEDNGFGTGKGDLPVPVIAAFKSEGTKWGGNYKGRTDPMHFEFVDNGEPERSFEEWLEELGASEKAKPQRPTPSPMTLMEFASEPGPVPTEKPAAIPPPLTPLQETTVHGDEGLWNIQRRLKAMGFNPGGLDGEWGDATAGAIGGFINARQSAVIVPTSFAMFNEVKEELKTEIAKAEGEKFVRVIDPKRAEATPEQLAPKLPEVQASITAERLGFWGSIGSAVTTTIAGVAKFMGDAVEWLNPLKEFVSDLPWPVWAGGALAISAALYFMSRKSREAKNAATQAYQEGARV